MVAMKAESKVHSLEKLMAERMAASMVDDLVF